MRKGLLSVCFVLVVLLASTLSPAVAAEGDARIEPAPSLLGLPGQLVSLTSVCVSVEEPPNPPNVHATGECGPSYVTVEVSEDRIQVSVCLRICVKVMVHEED